MPDESGGGGNGSAGTAAAGGGEEAIPQARATLDPDDFQVWLWSASAAGSLGPAWTQVITMCRSHLYMSTWRTLQQPLSYLQQPVPAASHCRSTTLTRWYRTGRRRPWPGSCRALYAESC